MSAQVFAQELVRALARYDPRALLLKTRKAPQKAAIIGLEDEGEWTPLLKLGAATPKFAKMMLMVRQGNRWTPTMQKGSPEQLAEQLASSLRHLWQIPLEVLHMPDF